MHLKVKVFVLVEGLVQLVVCWGSLAKRIGNRECSLGESRPSRVVVVHDPENVPELFPIIRAAIEAKKSQILSSKNEK